MRKLPALHLFILAVLITACAASPAHRLTHTYSVPQALRFIRQALMDRGYRIAIFDITAGIIKTERKTHTADDGRMVSHQISVTVVTADELLIKVLPTSARHAADQILAPMITSLQAMGFKPERPATSPPNL